MIADVTYTSSSADAALVPGSPLTEAELKMNRLNERDSIPGCPN